MISIPVLKTRYTFPHRTLLTVHTNAHFIFETNIFSLLFNDTTFPIEDSSKKQRNNVRRYEWNAFHFKKINLSRSVRMAQRRMRTTNGPRTKN